MTPSKLLKTALLAGCALVCLPASALDCRQPSSNPERLVCGSPRLLAADRALHEVYAAAREHASHPGEVERSQRAWAEATPSQCRTRACLAKAYAARMQQLADSYAGWCGSRTSELRHDWRGDAAALFEELSLGAGRFRSWLHQRPDSRGGWSSRGCRLVLHVQPEGEDVHWLLLDVGPRRLRVLDLDEQRISVYRRDPR